MNWLAFVVALAFIGLSAHNALVAMREPLTLPVTNRQESTAAIRHFFWRLRFRLLYRHPADCGGSPHKLCDVCVTPDWCRERGRRG